MEGGVSFGMAQELSPFPTSHSRPPSNDTYMDGWIEYGRSGSVLDRVRSFGECFVRGLEGFIIWSGDTELGFADEG